mmetsp:Transcript_13001/g.24426  ORF Transcript_13001/g.24426 Transcript_13001/m.24426 type:complete len:85 (+) Transcript_13001:254-508(+)
MLSVSSPFVIKEGREDAYCVKQYVFHLIPFVRRAREQTFERMHAFTHVLLLSLILFFVSLPPLLTPTPLCLLFVLIPKNDVLDE